MGQGSSKSKGGPSRCANCAYASPPRRVPSEPPHYICTRCHGLMPDPSANSKTGAPASSSASTSTPSKSILSALKRGGASSSGGYDTLESKDAIEFTSSSASSSAMTTSADGVQRVQLDRVHVAPFFETMPPDHQSFATSLNYESEMLANYLTEYFAQAAKLYGTKDAMHVTAGFRFQVKEVDFKVLSCYPPAGYVAERTSVRCMTKPLSAIAQIQKLHVLPVLASMPHTIDERTNEAKATLQLDPNEIFRDYIRPWIQDGPTSRGNGSASSTPAPPVSSSVYPAAAATSSSSSSSSSMRPRGSTSSSPDFEPRHIVEGDLFVSRPSNPNLPPLQFKIISCLPTNGVLTPETEIFTTGPPVHDIAKLQIHPIFESLPNNEKAWTGAQFFQKYLMPFFQGRFVFVKAGEIVQLDGVDFKIVAAEPVAGVVTSDTLIFNDGPPLRAEDLRQQQLLEDEQMARSMQMQEEAANRPAAMFRGGMPGGPLGFGEVTTPDQLRGRLAQILRMMPPNDPHRGVVQRLFDQLGQLPPNAMLHSPGDRGMMSLLRAAAGQAPPDRGASQADIDALPTRIYHAPAQVPSPDGAMPDAEKERVTCMVCLMEYEEGDELRTLPCFHSQSYAAGRAALRCRSMLYLSLVPGDFIARAIKAVKRIDAIEGKPSNTASGGGSRSNGGNRQSHGYGAPPDTTRRSGGGSARDRSSSRGPPDASSTTDSKSSSKHAGGKDTRGSK